MHILGVSAFYHDSAACLVRDGEIVAAAQEERFSRKKHDERFPGRAVDYCLREGGIGGADLDLVAFYDKPLLKFDRLLETYTAMAPRGLGLFMLGLPVWLHQKLHIVCELDRGLGAAYRGRYLYLEHHESHAASAFFPSPFDEAAIVTLDGVGEWATGTIGVGRGNSITVLKQMRFPHSLGLLYSAFTAFAGFRVNSGEYKLMGLAPYGKPVYRDLILDRLIDLRDDGSFRMDMSYFAYCHADRMTTPKFAALFDGPARQPESPLTEREMNLAASIQAVTEEIVLRVVRHAAALTGCRNLVLAGGVALNCVANGRVLREAPFDRVWVQPAAGDAGGALGAALFAWHQLLGKARVPRPDDAQKGSLLGPDCSDAETRALLEASGAIYEWYEDEDELVRVVARLIAEQRVVGHVAGRMEFGPRALGARSLLADPRSLTMTATLNEKIKFRESFRPFAPVVLRERVHEFFEMRPNEDSPYMQFVAPVRQDKRATIPAVTHVDGSARVQTVDALRSPRLHKILRAFEVLTGCPMIINTSFNVRGEPVVCGPEEAYRCFMATGMDVLVINNFVLHKDQQSAGQVNRAGYLAEFALD